jgi:hypothetical protein
LVVGMGRAGKEGLPFVSQVVDFALLFGYGSLDGSPRRGVVLAIIAECSVGTAGTAYLCVQGSDFVVDVTGVWLLRSRIVAHPCSNRGASDDTYGHTWHSYRKSIFVSLRPFGWHGQHADTLTQAGGLLK